MAGGNATGQLVQTLVSSSPPAYPIRLPGVRPDMSSALRYATADLERPLHPESRDGARA